MSTSSGRYAVPPEILKHKPRGSMVKKIHGGYYVYAMENVKNPVTGKWQTKTKEILGKITVENGYIPNEDRGYTVLEYGAYHLAEECTDEIKEQFQDLQKKFYDTNIENRKVLEENKSLQGLLENNETEKNEIMDRLNNISMNEYNSYISDIKGDHTISNYAGGNNKIINDLRLEKEQLNDELTTMAEKYEDSQRNFNNFVKSVQDKENCLKGDWIKKLNKHKEEYENIIVNLKKKQMKEIEQINTEHSIKLEETDNFVNESNNNFIDNNINNKVNPSVDDIFSSFQFLDIPVAYIVI